MVVCAIIKEDINIDMSSFPGGVVHDMFEGLENELEKNEKALETWMDITPLARNEWICWMTDAKKAETREKRLHWGIENLTEGKRRPCCWPGCKHR